MFNCQVVLFANVTNHNENTVIHIQRELREWLELAILLLILPLALLLLILNLGETGVDPIYFVFYLLFSLEFMIYPFYFSIPSRIIVSDNEMIYSQNFRKHRIKYSDFNSVVIRKVKIKSQRSLPNFVWSLVLMGDNGEKVALSRRGECNRWMDVVARELGERAEMVVEYEYWEGDDRKSPVLDRQVSIVDEL